MSIYYRDLECGGNALNLMRILGVSTIVMLGVFLEPVEPLPHGRGSDERPRRRKLPVIGVAIGDRLDYVTPLGIPFDGTYMLTVKGTPERPIVIRAAGDGEVIFDGDGCHELFNVMAADYHIFEGLTIRNADVAFQAGLKDIAGAKGLTVRNCRIENVGIGITTQFAGSRDFYLADNVIIGRKDRYRLQGWANPGLYGANPLRSYYGIRVYGSGHVVAHNAIAYFAIYHASDLDFRLKPGGTAVDAGAVIRAVNEDYSGKAPDLGALESGKPVPVYGPHIDSSTVLPLSTNYSPLRRRDAEKNSDFLRDSASLR